MFFKTIDEFQVYAGVNNTGLTLDTIHPAIRLASTEIKRILGATFYTAVLTAYTASTTEAPLTGWQAELVGLIQPALANLAMVPALDIIQTQVSDAGVQINSTATRSTAFRWQIQDRKALHTQQASAALDELLAYLESKIDDGDFAAWASSEAATAAAELLINRTEDFNREVDIRGSRLTFQKLLPLLRKSERFELEPLLGAAFLEELRELLKDRDLADPAKAAEKRLLEEYIRPALAHMVLARALRENAYRLNGDTLELAVFLDNPSGNRQQLSTLNTTELLMQQRTRAENDARTYVARLLAYLNATASDEVFATFFGSDRYTPSATPTEDPVKNDDPDQPVFFAL